MKRILSLLCLLALLFTGCAGTDSGMDRAMALRSKLLAQAVELDAVVTADYGDKTCTFTMACSIDKQGKLTFSVQEPESISGITGTVSSEGGKLTFDDQALAFPLLAEGQITPVSAPWVLFRSLRTGYLTSCGIEGGKVRLAIDDSYADDALHLDVWLSEDDLPAHGEIIYKGRRIVSVLVSNFRFV